ncbi:hypothetical protein CNMCM8927_001441 [Aspergillus lentulus]|uniref:WW domain-containing protein n=1 Tax=Aspergillus lentulus TaxID=293939 RepID=A0AAN5YH57_ASPLE|nr:hypothetical protein CNMCM6069_009080 [Aspergillus lentulus]KAF4172443.1 hypothetical protein CNMCM8060_001464 [Aspergillus lentulus]KAF4182559.1 hypothetical protein CNMCM7927_000028 [Aspergillus lentulus]KAF4199517.1 hypothetical protein CNMCM8694_003266 [Aspergillus lentulus]KAF4201501.1 hypothetical protein CNMCM8927_001441 [Aspergillus lentulus]
MSTNPRSSPLDRSPSTEKGATDSLSELPVDNQEESKTRERDTHEEGHPTQNKDEENDTSPSKTQDAEENTTGPHDDRENAPEEDASAPPLPDEPLPPPLPNEAPPDEDDGWEPVWDATAQAYYFYNRFTGVSQWENPRVPDAPSAPALAPVPLGDAAEGAKEKSPVVGGYNPAIHGDYDPTAPYAQQHEEPTLGGAGVDPSGSYEAVGTFNRFTGRWQPATVTPENYNDENKSRRQMNAFFDVDAAANAHDGRSLRAERSARKLTKKELKMFKEKRREKKEEKRRAWLRD